MKIRFGTLQDVPAFVEAGRAVHASTDLKRFEYNTERVAETLRGIIQRPEGSHCFIVAVGDDGSATGWIIGCIERHFFSDHLVASIINYGVLPEKRMSGAGLKLLMAFRKWGENRGAIELNAGVSSGIDLKKMDRFMLKLGFHLTGGNYSLMLTNPQAGHA